MLLALLLSDRRALSPCRRSDDQRHDHDRRRRPADRDAPDDAGGDGRGTSSTGCPVLAEVRPSSRPAPAALPAVQAAAAAATGFVAGAATMALVGATAPARLARARSRPRRAVDGLPIVGSRSFLVDVHLIAKPEE